LALAANFEFIAGDKNVGALVDADTGKLRLLHHDRTQARLAISLGEMLIDDRIGPKTEALTQRRRFPSGPRRARSKSRIGNTAMDFGVITAGDSSLRAPCDPTA
jgi:hypothetical protein